MNPCEGHAKMKWTTVNSKNETLRTWNNPFYWLFSHNRSCQWKRYRGKYFVVFSFPDSLFDLSSQGFRHKDRSQAIEWKKSLTRGPESGLVYLFTRRIRFLSKKKKIKKKTLNCIYFYKVVPPFELFRVWHQ